MPYADVLMQHFHRPKNQRVLDAPDAVGVAGVPGRGPFLVLYLRLDAGGRVAEAAFQTHGCAPSIAAGSLLATVLPGEVPDAALVPRWAALRREGVARARRGSYRVTSVRLGERLPNVRRPSTASRTREF